MFAAMSGTDPATFMREWAGMSAVALADGIIYYTYSTYVRGLDGLWGMYQRLDRAPSDARRRACGGDAKTSTNKSIATAAVWCRSPCSTCGGCVPFSSGFKYYLASTRVIVHTSAAMVR